MATAEQMQEALQQQQHELQVLGARVAALENTAAIRISPSSDTRTGEERIDPDTSDAEQERSSLIQSLGAMRTRR